MLPENTTSATMVIALYNRDGKMLGAKIAGISEADKTAEFTFKYSADIYRYNVMVFKNLNKLNCFCKNFSAVIE